MTFVKIATKKGKRFTLRDIPPSAIIYNLNAAKRIFRKGKKQKNNKKLSSNWNAMCVYAFLTS